MKALALGAAVVGATALVIGHAAPAAAAEATGCLTSGGQIRNVAVGGLPSRPCAPGETEIALQLAPSETETPDTSGDIFPFFLLLNDDTGAGTEQTVATVGPLEFAVVCDRTVVGDGEDIEVGIHFTSESGSGSYTIQGTGFADLDFGPGNFNQDVELGISAPASGTYFYWSSQPQFAALTAIAPGGHYLRVTDIMAGTNIFDHDCLVTGTVAVIEGDDTE